MTKEIESLSSLNYQDLAKEIIHPFIVDFMSVNELSDIVDKSYSVFRKDNAVDLIKVGDTKILELFHGPTLAFKDIAMQLLGNFYEHYLKKNKKNKCCSCNIWGYRCCGDRCNQGKEEYEYICSSSS